jgi:hypothetical protein
METANGILKGLRLENNEQGTDEQGITNKDEERENHQYSTINTQCSID